MHSLYQNILWFVIILYFNKIYKYCTYIHAYTQSHTGIYTRITYISPCLLNLSKEKMRGFQGIQSMKTQKGEVGRVWRRNHYLLQCYNARFMHEEAGTELWLSRAKLPTLPRRSLNPLTARSMPEPHSPLLVPAAHGISICPALP